VTIVGWVGGSTRRAANQLLDRGFHWFDGHQLVVVGGWGVAQGELLEVGFVQWIDPLAAVGTELLVLEFCPAVAAGLLRQEIPFLVRGIVPRA
jgi:hypothetical protein